jgi:putative sigma-54 modulation protein
MKLHIHGKNVTVTQAMQESAEKKLTMLEKYFNVDENTSANISIKVYPASLKVEITVFSKVGILRAEVKHPDYYAALDLAIDKLEEQIRKQKTRLSRKHHEKLAKAFVNEPEIDVKVQELVRTKTIQAQEMSLDDAIMNMEMLGHSFFIYTDEEEKQISVVYKRLDGGYGLLHTSQA